MSASVIRYRKLVTTDLANQAVNLAESGTMGHRVQMPMSVDDMNSFFVWDRPAGSDRAVGHFVATTPSGLKFADMMVASLSRSFTDVDGVTNGLNFSSAVLDANTDGRVRRDGSVSANDLVMAYLLYKCYGSSAAPTAAVIYNLEDAQQMLSNGGLTLAIQNSLAAEEALSNAPGVDKGSVDAMFRDLLAADPMRFFDATGKQIAGLFETNLDADSSGNWQFVENDKIEMRVQFNFTNAVTRRGVQDVSQGLESAANNENVDTVVIPAGSKFTIRLQIVATDTPSGAASKASASASAISAALAAQVALTKKAADNAVAAQVAAAAAMNAAASQTAAATARYEKLVNDAAAQAIAVSNAQAALRAAQAALNQAIATGSPQSEVQNQRAAAVAAAAAVQNAEAIAAAAQAEIQNARNAQNAAAAALAAAQTATATASANLAKANAAAASAALAASKDAAAKAAVDKAAADAASDPFTKNLTDAEKKILDPQTVITAQAIANARTDSRVVAKTASDKSMAVADLARQKQVATAKELAHAIAHGYTLATVQILRAAAVTALNAKNSADAVAAVDVQNFLNAARAELSAQQFSAKASSDACVLRVSMANANVNSKERVRATAEATNTAAQAANVAAQAAATNAQNDLDAAIAAGAVFIEVQTKRKAALDRREAANVTKNAADKAAAALVDAVSAKKVAVNAASEFETARVADIAASRSRATLLNNYMVASTNYQTSRIYLANANARAQEFNRAQMNMNDARQKYQAASADYIVARDLLDVAVKSGKTVPEIVALRTKAQAAADLEAEMHACLNAEIEAFNVAQRALMMSIVLDASGSPAVDENGALVIDVSGELIWDASANGILEIAAENNLLSITNAEANTLVLNYLKAQGDADSAASDLVKARNLSEVARKALENGVTGGLTLSQISALRAAAVAAASEHAKAEANANAYAKAAVLSLGKALSPRPTYAAAVAILNSMRILQGQSDNAARNNEMAAALNLAYKKDIDAQKALVTAQYAQYVADKALNDACVGGASIEAIRDLQEKCQAAAKLTSACQETAAFTASALAQQLAWSTANFSIDDAGAQVSLNYSLDASGVAVLLASREAAKVAAEAARCNALVRQYMELLTKADAAQTETYKAKAEVDTATANLNIAITQGGDLASIQALRNVVQSFSNKLAAVEAAENLAKATTASSLASLRARDAAGNYINAAAVAILDAAVLAQQKAIDLAAANSQVSAYNVSFAAYQQRVSELSAALSAADLASKALDIAIAAGADVAEIQRLRLVLEGARAAQSVAQTARDNAFKAQEDRKNAILTGVRDASGVLLARSKLAIDLLIQAQLDQESAVANAESNERARMYFKAKNHQSAANVVLDNAQAAYDAAARRLDQAVTGGATLPEIEAFRASAQEAGNFLARAQSIASDAARASAVAQEAVNADPKALAILNDMQLYEANKANLAKANSLIDLWNAAVASEAAAQRDYDLADLAKNIAMAALDKSIADGAGITEIKALRDTSVEAATTASTLMATLNLKKAEALKARTDAAADPLASVILDTQIQFNKIADASTAVNAALIALRLSEEALLAANAKALADKNASVVANFNLNCAILPYDASGNNITASPFGGKTTQEIVDLRVIANNLAQVSSASKAAADNAAADLIVKKNAKAAADAALAAIPFPQPQSTQSYTMTTVSLNEAKLVKDASGQHVYIDSNVMVNALKGNNLGGVVYPAVPLTNVNVMGLGVSSLTKILSAQVVASVPVGLYPETVKLTLDKDVVIGDGLFYLAGGEILLKNYIM